MSDQKNSKTIHDTNTSGFSRQNPDLAALTIATDLQWQIIYKTLKKSG